MADNNLTNKFIPVPLMIDEKLPDSSLIRSETLREVLKYMYDNMEGGGSGGSSEAITSLIKQIFGGEIIPEIQDELNSASILEHLKKGITPKYINLSQGLSIDNYITGIVTSNNNTFEILTNEIVFIKEYYKTVPTSNNYDAQRTYVVVKTPGVYGKPTNSETKPILKDEFGLIADGLVLQNSSDIVKTVENVKADNRGNISLLKKAILWTTGKIDDEDKYKMVPVLDEDTGETIFVPRGEFGKVKTVAGFEPDENGDIKLPEPEFLENGLGWSLKYAVDNPTFYGVTGDKAVNLSYTPSSNTYTNFPYGAIGMYSFTTGFKNSALGIGAVVLGANNLSSGQTNHIIGYRSSITEDRGTDNIGKHSNGIFAGENNFISNNIQSVIIGGTSNKIVGSADAKSGVFSKANVILGGLNNEILSSPETNRPAYSSFILGGELNKAQGYYNVVGGYQNHAVTLGETLFGIYSTIQNTSLNGYDYLPDSRIFNIGVGVSNTNNTFVRRDGLSVFRNGLVTVPTLTPALIDAETTGKVVITKEYVNIKLDSQEDSINNTIVKTIEAFISSIRPLPNNIYTLRTLLNNPTITPLEYIDGTYVKKTISNYQVTYEPTTLVNASGTISITEEGILTLSQEGILFRVWYKHDPAKSIVIKSKATTLSNLYLTTNGETLCFEEILTGIVTELLTGDNIPPIYSTASFIGKYLVGNKEPKTVITVTSTEGESIYNGIHNKEDSVYCINLSSSNLEKGHEYFVISSDENGNTIGPVTVTYN